MTESVIHQILSLLAVTSIKGTIIIGAVYLLTLVCKKMSPEVRHLLWLSALLSFILLPAVRPVFRSLEFGFFPLPPFDNKLYESFTSLMVEYDPAYTRIVQPPDATGVFSTISLTAGTSAMWYPAIISIWGIGVAFSITQLICGRYSMRRIMLNARHVNIKRFWSLMSNKAHQLGINRNINLFISEACTVPFTFGKSEPAVVLPAEALAWTDEQLKSVLTHELSHIKRGDYATQLLARILCSFYWFLPLVWLAFYRLHLEQEKACDRIVILGGTEPLDYAGQMVSFVKNIRKRFMYAGLLIVKNKRTVFEKRIFHILNIKSKISTGANSGFITRKKVISIGIVFALLVCFYATLGTELGAHTLSVSEEEFYEAYTGIWTNPENTGEMTDPQLAVYQRDKTMIYGKMESEFPILIVRPLFTATWRDDDGNIWFTGEWERTMFVKHFEVGKISNGGRTLQRFGSHEPIKGWLPGDPFSDIAGKNIPCYNLVMYKTGGF